MIVRHPIGFDLWDEVEPFPSIGSASTLSREGAAKRKREFAPGFHGANPGPSHEEPPPRRRRKRTTRGTSP